MKKIILVGLLVTIASYSAHAQLIKSKTESHKLEFGYIHRTYIMTEQHPVTFYRYYWAAIGGEPYIAYYPFKNIGLGVSGYYNFVRSNFITLPSTYSVGVFSRFYLPYKLNIKFLDRFTLYLQAEYRKSNYIFSYNQPQHKSLVYTVSYPFISEKIENDILCFPFAANFRLSESLHIEVGYEFRFFLQGDDMFGSRLGVVYYFLKSKETELLW